MHTEAILHVPMGTLAKYPVKDLQRLLSKAVEQLDKCKLTKQWIESAISLKYEEQIRAKRLRLEKESGVIHLEDSGFKVSCEVAKKVEWDQRKLAEIAANIIASGGNAAEYVDTHYNIHESKYSSWSSGVRDIFAPARTVKLGRPIYKLTKLNGEAGL